MQQLDDQSQSLMDAIEQQTKIDDEKRQKLVESAASVLEAMETKGGKALMAYIEELEKEADPGLVGYLKQDTTSTFSVDVFAVAKAVGQVAVLRTLHAYFDSCRRIVENQAKM